MHVAGLLVMAIIVAAGLGWLWAKSRQAETSEPFFTLRCPDCGQKVRYRASRAGRTALCPRCKRPARLPFSPPVVGAQPAGPGRGPLKVGQRRA
jgi:hypothetical protein